MWVCARCRSNNELDACWRCGAAAAEAAVPAPEPAPPLPAVPAVPAGTPGWNPAAVPGFGAAPPGPMPVYAGAVAGYGTAAPWPAPAGLPPYGMPGWAPGAPARASVGRRVAIVVAALVAAGAAAVGVLTVVGRQTATLTTPPAIGGEGRLTDTGLDSTTGMLSQALKSYGAGSTVVAVYGSGSPQHLLVAASGGLERSNDAFVRDVVAGAATAGATIDSSQLSHVTFGGAQYSCGAVTGAAATIRFCTWWGGGDGGAVYALPGASGDLLAYTEQARRAVTGG